jgi:hypothetical protein
LRPHDRHSAHVLQTYRLARRAVIRSIGFSSSPAFDSNERTMTVLTRYSSSTPFSFVKENYVSLQRKRRSVSPVLLTLPNVQPASSSYARQPLKEYRALASIPTNFARISAVTARVTTSDAHLWDISSAMPTLQNPGGGGVAVGLCLMDVNRTIPPSPRNARAPKDRLWDTSSSLPPTIRLEGKGNIASLCLMDVNCDTSSLSNSRLSELHATPAATNPTLALPGSTEAATTGLGHSAYEGNTASLCLMGMNCRTSTPPTALPPTKADADGKP